MKAVSNSSPLIAFSAIDRLDLLHSFFSKISFRMGKDVLHAALKAAGED